jgi:hypothetical protein
MNHLGRKQQLEVNGKVYTLGRLTTGDVSTLIDWINSKTTHPLDELTMERLAKYTPAIQAMLVKNAQDKAEMRRDYNSPHIQASINSPEGTTKVFHLILAKEQPGTTEAQASELYNAAVEQWGVAHVQQLIQRTQGIYVPDEEDVEEAEAKKKPSESKTLPQTGLQ